MTSPKPLGAILSEAHADGMSTRAPHSVHVEFNSPGLAEQLGTMSRAELDELDFGVIAMDRRGTVFAYNRNESQRAWLAPERVVGRNFFTDVGPCTDNELVADRFRRAAARERGALDEQLDYVFTFRLRYTPVRLRLLAAPDSWMQHLLVRDR